MHKHTPAPWPVFSDTNERDQLIAALACLALDPRTIAYLEKNDPKALQQARAILGKVGVA